MALEQICSCSAHLHTLAPALASITAASLASQPSFFFLFFTPWVYMPPSTVAGGSLPQLAAALARRRGELAAYMEAGGAIFVRHAGPVRVKALCHYAAPVRLKAVCHHAGPVRVKAISHHAAPVRLKALCQHAGLVRFEALSCHALCSPCQPDHCVHSPLSASADALFF